MAQTAGEVIADTWQEGLENAVASLAQLPGRCPVAQEAALFGLPPIRQLLYRRTRTGPAYRVLFRMHEEPDEMPFVRVIAVRHGAQAPMTEDDASSIQNEE
jgi:plasmid stabilization system protein ParE